MAENVRLLSTVTALPLEVSPPPPSNEYSQLLLFKSVAGFSGLSLRIVVFSNGMPNNFVIFSNILLLYNMQ